MDKLKKFAPILLFVVVLGLGAALVNFYYEVPKEVLAEKRYETNLITLDSKLHAKTVDGAYAYSPERGAELKKLPGQVEANTTRPSRTIDDKIGTYVAYPAPTRPRSNEIIPDKEPVDIYGKLRPLTNVAAHADQGAIYVQFDFPEMKPKEDMMELVRVEVRRSTDPKNFDLGKPYGTVELGPEEPVTAAAAAVAPVTPAAPAERVRGTAVPPTPGPKKPAPIVLPKFTRVFRDSNVDQKTEYFYQLRLVGRFTSTEGKFEPNKKDGAIIPGPGFKMHAPNDKSYTLVPPQTAGSTTQLYALPPTPPVNATAPTNFTIRLEGIVGTPPKTGQPRDPASPLIRDYAAKFDVRVWIADTQKWERSHIEVKEGDPLTGKVSYRNKDGQKTDYDYTQDLGYKFDQIVFEEDTVSKIKGQLVETAILDNVKTKQKEKYQKSSTPKERTEALVQLDAIWKEQEDQRKKELEKRKASADKVKADAAARATPQ